MAKRKAHKQNPIFVTNDKALREGKRLGEGDREILRSMQTGEGLITIKSVNQLKELAKATGERFKEFQEMCSPMTLEQAKVVRRLRVDEGYSWRAVAEACYQMGWGKWAPPSNQILGMALCWRAAQLLVEDYEKEPWN